MNKIQRLIATGQKIFRTQDLARIWGIHNVKTLHTTVSRYSVNSSPLYPIQKGLYRSNSSITSYPSLGTVLSHPKLKGGHK